MRRRTQARRHPDPSAAGWHAPAGRSACGRGLGLDGRRGSVGRAAWWLGVSRADAGAFGAFDGVGEGFGGGVGGVPALHRRPPRRARAAPHAARHAHPRGDAQHSRRRPTRPAPDQAVRLNHIPSATHPDKPGTTSSAGHGPGRAQARGQPRLRAVRRRRRPPRRLGRPAPRAQAPPSGQLLGDARHPQTVSAVKVLRGRTAAVPRSSLLVQAGLEPLQCHSGSGEELWVQVGVARHANRTGADAVDLKLGGHRDPRVRRRRRQGRLRRAARLRPRPRHATPDLGNRMSGAAPIKSGLR